MPRSGSRVRVPFFAQEKRTLKIQKSKASKRPPIKSYAKIAQLVEHDLAKVGVAGSSPVFRSKRAPHGAFDLICPDGGIGRRATLRG